MKIVDFTDINLYPNLYYIDKKTRTPNIKSLIIENIKKQKKNLITKNTILVVGDVIVVDFVFGHNVGRRNREAWKDFHVSGHFKINKITTHHGNQIELTGEFI